MFVSKNIFENVDETTETTSLNSSTSTSSSVNNKEKAKHLDKLSAMKRNVLAKKKKECHKWV